ncbi:MAG: DUF3810 family protein, partial [Tannerella sp.]|nr:DUF3810 family protein [Tannerella sp.]
MQKYSKTRTYIKYLIPIVLLAFVFICSKIPTLAESYMQHVYPVLATVLSFISGLVSFSLLDVLIILVIIALTVSIVLMLRRKISFRSWAKVVILSLLWLPVWFYLARGIGYFRPDFFSRVGVERQPPDKDFFEAFVERYIDKLNQTYPD